MSNFTRYMPKQSKIVFIVILCIALGVSLGMNSGHGNLAYADSISTHAALSNRSALSGLEDAFTSIVDHVGPSVVQITSDTKVSPQSMSSPGDDFFKGFPFPFAVPETPNPQTPQTISSMGTGVIVRADGYILTNDHVVGGAELVKVKLKDGREFKGAVTRDPRSDLALIKIKAKNLPAATLGSSSKLKVGSWAIAIGSPFGLDQTVTVGVVSAVKRQEAVENKFYPNLIQTDASINPGNSGGPLVNIYGEIIGINTLIRSDGAGGNIGIGFAIPIDTAKFVLNQLIEHGKVTRGYIGIIPVDLDPAAAEVYGVETGALLKTVIKDGPAYKAKLQPEDVIVEIDGINVADSLQLRNILDSTPPGKTVDVVYYRNKVRKTSSMTIGESKEDIAKNPDSSQVKLGFSVEDLTPEILSNLKIPEGTKGVIVSSITPGTKAGKYLQPGMIITRVNGVAVESVADFDDVVSKVASGSILRLRILARDGETLAQIPIE